MQGGADVVIPRNVFSRLELLYKLSLAEKETVTTMHLTVVVQAIKSNGMSTFGIC